MHRFENDQSGPRFALILLLGMTLWLVPVARATGGAVVSGVVRDAQGTAQMGALVQVLGADSVTVATAWTDSHGRYAIANLAAGRYLVRASATLLVPATKANLILRNGATTVVNLTLAALFDTTSWLPAERRRADEPDDDWKWTLRSTASRPILRILHDGEMIDVSSSAEQPQADKLRARATVASGGGEFGQGGVHTILAIHRSLDDGGDMVLRSDMGSGQVPTGFGPSQEFEAGYEHQVGFSGADRTVAAYKSHPELAASTGTTAGLQSMTITSGRRLSMGDLFQAEVGGSLQMLSTSRVGVATHPFVRLTAHPIGTWTLHYRMASDRQLQGFEDVTTGETEVPVALVKNGKLALESGRHQEASVDHKVGRGSVSFAYYHDAMVRTAVSGSGNALAGSLSGETVNTMLVDPTTGTFRSLATAYKTKGPRITASAPLLPGLWVAAEYSSGDAVSSDAGQLAIFPAALSALRAEAGQAATLAMKGRIKATGTRIRTSYRWQPSKFVTAVDPYSTFGDQSFFSCQLRQPIHWGARLPSGLDATIDVTNLLAQGYRPFLSADGQTLYFAQAPRTIQGGVSFSF